MVMPLKKLQSCEIFVIHFLCLPTFVVVPEIRRKKIRDSEQICVLTCKNILQYRVRAQFTLNKNFNRMEIVS